MTPTSTSNNTIDHSLAGKTIRLIRTSDPYTKLKPNDLGIIKHQYRNLDVDCISVKWDAR